MSYNADSFNHKEREIMLNQAEIEVLLRSIGTLSIAMLLGVCIALVINAIISKWGKSITLLRWTVGLAPLRAPLLSIFPALCSLSALAIVKLTPEIEIILKHTFRVWLFLSLGWLAIRVIGVCIQVILSQYDLTAVDNLKARSVHTQISVIHKIISVFVLFITIALTLLTFDSVRQVGMSILASAGVMGIVIGFAAQKTLGNLMAGIQIALAQPIRLDDVVVVEGEWGRIEDIALTYVVVKIWDERRLVLPISYFTEKPFQNWTRTNAQILGTVFIYTDYRIPVEKIRQKLTEILEESSNWDKKVNVLQVTNTSEKTIELRALMSAVDSSTAWTLRCEVREALIGYLQKELPEHLPKTRVELEKEKSTEESAKK
jgi:small-conductance mechanosensitive channel